jgi:hypothetical protein
MNSRAKVVIFFMLVVCSLQSQAQLWSPILGPSQAVAGSGQAIDWQGAGVGGIPARTTNCAVLTSSATVTQINAALASCHSGQTVYLSAGTYSITGSIRIPSNVTLRGAGANLTILNATGTSGGNVVNLGTGGPPYGTPTISITSGATAGSTSIVVSSTSGISVGTYLGIGEINNSSYVTSSGSEGVCTWCDNGWSSTGAYARGQVVQVTGVSGTTIKISPGLYGAYTNSPLVASFNSATVYAGVENLQVYANHTGYNANFGMAGCAYCWIKGVESNYTDGDHVEVYWGYHDEVRDSYFSNAYLHTPGSHDSDVVLAIKTSASLVENNIIERTHAAIMLEWGAAGNVVAYNYTEGEFDSSSTNVVQGGFDDHGAHPQFNLLEGNVTTKFSQDSIWGSSSQSTYYRNWSIGTNLICLPLSGRGTVSCSGANGHYGFQASRAMDMSYLATLNNFVGNVVGSSQMQSLIMLYSPGTPLAQVASVEYPSVRQYANTAYGWSFGYGEASDSGTGTGCDGPTGPCHLAGTSATDFFLGNYNNISSTITPTVTQSLPASFYLPSKPAWWGSMPFPATGPDVTGGTGPGGHSYGNPAQACYFNVMGGSDGGAGSPLTFNASACYGPPPPTGLTGTVH